MTAPQAPTWPATPAAPARRPSRTPAGHFGRFGGRLAPEALMSALDELTAAYESAKADPAFQAELAALLRGLRGPADAADRGAAVRRGGGRRPGLPQARGPGPHRLPQDQQRDRPGPADQADGQDPDDRRDRGRPARRGHGDRGALLGLDCVVYMGEEDTRRQALNVARMRMLGAEVVPVTIGSQTLKDAINEAFRDWVATVETTHYCIGSVMGPHPFPTMVRDFQRIIGVEAREQVLAAAGPAARRGDRLRRRRLQRDRRLPRVHPDDGVRLIGCEAGGDGLASRPPRGHGGRRVARRDPRHAHLPDAGRRRPDPADPLDLRGPGLPRGRSRALLAARHRPGQLPRRHRRRGDGRVRTLCRTEGIIPAIESAHALAGRAAGRAGARRRTRCCW